jgi:hypothetical protein
VFPLGCFERRLDPVAYQPVDDNGVCSSLNGRSRHVRCGSNSDPKRYLFDVRLSPNSRQAAAAATSRFLAVNGHASSIQMQAPKIRLLGEERMRRAGRSSLLQMNDSRLQFKFGKAEAKFVREHIAKPLDAAYCSAIHFA